MINKLLKTTVKLRHYLVKLITPKLYNDAYMNVGIFRPFFSQLDSKKPLIGVEIGVNKGDNAKHILQTLNIKKLFLVDPYIEYVDGDKRLWSNRKKDLIEAKKKLKPFSSKIQWILSTSENAVAHIPDNLDFVYSDGDHKKTFIKKDGSVNFLWDGKGC